MGYGDNSPLAQEAEGVGVVDPWRDVSLPPVFSERPPAFRPPPPSSPINWEQVAMRRAEELGAAQGQLANEQRENESLRAQKADLERKLNTAQQDLDSNCRSWQRALGNKLFRKRHLIDALVMTTEWLQQGFDKWEKERAHWEKEREKVRLAKTLGIVYNPFQDE